MTEIKGTLLTDYKITDLPEALRDKIHAFIIQDEFFNEYTLIFIPQGEAEEYWEAHKKTREYKERKQ